MNNEMRFWACQILSYLSFQDDTFLGVVIGIAWGVGGLIYLRRHYVD